MAKKNILGLDLGTTSIGWAHVIEGDTTEESEIVKIGVRVNPLSVDEQTDFEKGKPITINADRTLKRGMRRNLDRYQLRRENLVELLKGVGFIDENTPLTEDGKSTTFETWRLRSLAVSEQIGKAEFARVLLAINKKRGYKSSRKAKNSDEGMVIDSMAIAKQLYDDGLTPGQLSFNLLKDGKKRLPDFYRSDLQSEFDLIWNYQKTFYPEILTNEFYNELRGKGQKATSSAFWIKYKLNTSDIKDLEDSLKNPKTIALGLREKKKLQAYYWRSIAPHSKLDLEEVAYVITEINSNLNNSSGYLGAISDRSKELYFNKQTVGQYLYAQLLSNRHTKLKNQVFYRQDYLDEFEAIWNEQSKHYAELTDSIKTEIRDITIFYQRRLKSQKALISLCEFEWKERIVEKDGKKRKVRTGFRVAPKSSPLFQEFKIWQILNNLLVKKKGSRKRSADTVLADDNEGEIFILSTEQKELLFEELNIKGKLSATQILTILGVKPSEWSLNYESVEGNSTNKVLYTAYLDILELEGYDVKDLLNVKSNKDEVELSELLVPSGEIKSKIAEIFDSLKIQSSVLDFNPYLEGAQFEKQASYQLWHLLYAYEGDDSKSGNELLYNLLKEKFGFSIDQAKILANIQFQDDYGSLSTKAIKKIIPYLKENKYSEACQLAGYKHSASSLTRSENDNRPLKDKLELVKKNSLRNPVVEKILNQMVNVVNTLLEEKRNSNPNFKFDEIRIELARELKKNAKERAELTSAINSAKDNHEKIVKLLQSEFGVKNPSRNDIIRYKLYEELKSNGYKDFYTNQYIPREILFSKNIDVDHIIPQSKLFDDSFSNKTLVYRNDNLEKSNKTAIEFVEARFSKDKLDDYIQGVQRLYEMGLRSKEGGISKAKYQKLLKRSEEIGDGFIERDLRDSQYIAKEAKKMLFEITRGVVSTSGSITDRLREDWGLVNIMQELSIEKYRALGLTEQVEKKDGTFKERIIDWTKRSDHRHHAMDALTVAFTKPSYIQYLNHLNARYQEQHKVHNVIKAIENKETQVVKDDQGNSTRIFTSPLSNFRSIAREHLEGVLVSFKAKNKVATKNTNKIKTKNGTKTQIALTPRGQLHKETVYGKMLSPIVKDEKIDGKFDAEKIGKVTNPVYREKLMERLLQNGGDPKKAFTGKNALNKTPIVINAGVNEVLPEKVKTLYYEDMYTIRKDIGPDLKLDKIIDEGVKTVLKNRLEEYGNDPKKAFVDLEKNPIWLNKEKGISIKRVTISGVSTVERIGIKRDHFGKALLDSQGNNIPADFVSTGNNHHVAIYEDDKGGLHERVVSMFEAVQLKNAGLEVVDKSYNSTIGWKFMFSMKTNEYFIFPNKIDGIDPMNIDLFDKGNYKLISRNLYRVQKLTTKDYTFRHHLETTVADNSKLKDIAFKRLTSIPPLVGTVKVRLDHLGNIVSIGE
jgi:CRISPR-associated endonuclease Csn1